jgi:hypothetical protein
MDIKVLQTFFVNLKQLKPYVGVAWITIFRNTSLPAHDINLSKPWILHLIRSAIWSKDPLVILPTSVGRPKYRSLRTGVARSECPVYVYTNGTARRLEPQNREHWKFLHWSSVHSTTVGLGMLRCSMKCATCARQVLTRRPGLRGDEIKSCNFSSRLEIPVIGQGSNRPVHSTVQLANCDVQTVHETSSWFEMNPAMLQLGSVTEFALYIWHFGLSCVTRSHSSLCGDFRSELVQYHFVGGGVLALRSIWIYYRKCIKNIILECKKNSIKNSHVNQDILVSHKSFWQKKEHFIWHR